MKQEKPVSRKGFFKRMAAAAAGLFGAGFALRGRRGPEERDLREADYYRRHDLAG